MLFEQPSNIGPEWKMNQRKRVADAEQVAGCLTAALHVDGATQMRDPGPQLLLDHEQAAR